MAQMFGLARLGKDAELRFTQGGDPVAGLALAFSYGKKGDDGKRPTQWVEASMWGARAEALAPYLLKGGLVSVTLSEVHIETYQGKNGEGHKLVGRVTEIELAGGNQQQGQQQPQQRQQAQAPRQQSASRPAPNFSDMDDSIPFANPYRGKLGLAI
jgi:single-strand DNA-binding protein